MGRPSETATIYLTSPTLGHKVDDCWLSGFAQAVLTWHGRLKCETYGESGLPLARDRLAAQFLLSGCSHWLSVDTDHLWTVEAAEKLIDLDVDIATGIYAKKDETNAPVLYPIPETKPEGPWKIFSAGAGFQVVKRETMLRLFEAYSADLAYDFPNSDIKTVALHQPHFYQGEYRFEDISLYCRWHALGGEAWAHPDAVVGHFDGHKMHWPRWGVQEPEMAPLPDRIEIMKAPNGTVVLHDQANGITAAATVAEAQRENMAPEDLAALRWRAQWDQRHAA